MSQVPNGAIGGPGIPRLIEADVKFSPENLTSAFFVYPQSLNAIFGTSPY